MSPECSGTQRLGRMAVAVFTMLDLPAFAALWVVGVCLGGSCAQRNFGKKWICTSHIEDDIVRCILLLLYG